jgi:hypothetical protein
MNIVEMTRPIAGGVDVPGHWWTLAAHDLQGESLVRARWKSALGSLRSQGLWDSMSRGLGHLMVRCPDGSRALRGEGGAGRGPLSS